MAIESISGTPVNRSLPTNSTVNKDTSGVKQQSISSGSVGSTAFTNASQGIASAIAAGGANVSVVNEDRVAAIKASIQNGSYKANSAVIADKMLKFENQLPNST